MKLWLDDLRPAPDDSWLRCTNAFTAIRFLSGQMPKQEVIVEVSLDHDLGNEQENGTGYNVISWIEERVHMDKKYTPPKIFIHTANPVAMKRMQAASQAIDKAVSKR